MYKLVVFVPETHLESLKEALFGAGAGGVGDYDRCSWQVLGEGQFRPLVGSSPFVGSAGQRQKVAEYRLELAVADETIEPVVRALYAAHPYEEPAFDCWRVEDFSRLKPTE